MNGRKMRGSDRGRKAVGWLISVMMLAAYYSPQATLLRELPDTLSIAAGQQLVMETGFPLTIQILGMDVNASASQDERLGGQSTSLSDVDVIAGDSSNDVGGDPSAVVIGGVNGDSSADAKDKVNGSSANANGDSLSIANGGVNGDSPSTANGDSSVDQNGDADGDPSSPTRAKATISLFGVLPLREVEIDVSDDLRLHPGGQAVGVALHTSGVLVVGMSDLSGHLSPARAAGLKAGDLIMAIGGTPVSSTTALTDAVAAAGEQALPLTVKRGDSMLELSLTPKRDGQTGAFRIGAWVRDSTAGVGTLSFYGEVNAGEGERYGALGHAITDADTQQILTVGHGDVMLADVVDVRKGQIGVPGELKGSFLREQRVMGEISQNTVFGIYGAMNEPPAHPLYPDGLPIGRRDAVHTGAATILCTVDAGGMREYDVEIVEVARQSAPAQRSMVLRVTDEALLEKTGGIVQGMSGSPIIQDGRLIGAVTHVFVNDPTMGYGLFIEWMLGQAGEG